MFCCTAIFSRYHLNQHLFSIQFSKTCYRLLTILLLCLHHIFFWGGGGGRKSHTSSLNNIKYHFTMKDKCGFMLFRLTIASELRPAHNLQKTEGYFGTPVATSSLKNWLSRKNALETEPFPCPGCAGAVTIYFVIDLHNKSSCKDKVHVL